MAYFAARRTLTTLSSITKHSRLLYSILPKIATPQILPDYPKFPTRFKSNYSPLNDASPNSRPPRETILLDGCDYEHWLIVMEFPNEPKLTEEEMVNSYVKTLASVLGSEEEAKKKIYSVNTRTYTGFGALISEELSYKVKELPGVLWVLPDSYLDVNLKDYGGDLFVDGKVIHRPQYWFNNETQGRGNRPRPRHDRRRESMYVERREPMHNSGQQGQQMQQASSIHNPNPAQGGQ